MSEEILTGLVGARLRAMTHEQTITELLALQLAPATTFGDSGSLYGIPGGMPAIDLGLHFHLREDALDEVKMAQLHKKVLGYHKAVVGPVLAGYIRMLQGEADVQED
jgi:hypothetical protein